MRSGNRNLVIVVVLCALAAVLVWWLRRDDGGEVVSEGPATDETSRPSVPALPKPKAPEPELTRQRVQLAPALAELDADATHGLFTGKVVDWGTGDPVAGAEVVFAAGDQAVTVVADDGGQFRFVPPEAGRYRLAVASAHGYLPFAPAWSQSPIELVARAGMRVDGILVYLSPAIDYTGVVLDPDGEPVGGAEVKLLGAGEGEQALLPLEDSFTSAGDGTFTFHAPDLAVLEATHPCCEPGSKRLDSAAQISRRLEIELGTRDHLERREPKPDPAASASIRGVVTAGGDPVPAFAVVVLRTRGLAESAVKHVSVFDARGRFEVGDLKPGDYVVRAMAHGFARSEAVPAVAEDDPTREVEIELPRGGTLTGRVVDAASREPLENARVTVEGTIGAGSSAVPLSSSVVTDARGEFELPGLPPGRASVVAAAFDHHQKIVGGLEVTEGARLGPVTIELTPLAEGETPRLELAGIGATLGAGEGGLVIQSVFEGSGAEAAGLGPGDVILEVDGQPVSELGFGGSIQKIRGVEGSSVRLRVRGEGDTVREIDVVRGKIRA